MIRFLIAMGCAMTLISQNPEKESLGTGRRGWLFCQDVVARMNHPGTFKVSIAFDPDPPLGESPIGFDENRSVVLYEETLSDGYIKTIPKNFWGGWTSFLCFSFDKNELFSFDRLIRVEDGKIRIYPGQVQTEARKRFGLKNDQIYLGAVEGKRFYWIKEHPGVVYFFEDGQEPRRVYQLRLDTRITEPLGMAKGNPQGDFALEAAAKPIRRTATPRIIQWFALNCKDAEPVKYK